STAATGSGSTLRGSTSTAAPSRSATRSACRGPDEMGIGPVFAVPRLLERQGCASPTSTCGRLNEAFASQSVYCRDRLGIDPSRVNVNGGAIAVGHPFGMSGAR
ncbi:acetyl-CoA C-acyltransferase, partial [Methylobacterium radiotolerans]